jgi:hypothetical protein
MLRVYQGGKPAARHQLVEATHKATVIRNELECIQWQHSMAQQLGTCMRSDGGYYEHVF